MLNTIPKKKKKNNVNLWYIDCKYLPVPILFLLVTHRLALAGQRGTYGGTIVYMYYW